MTKGLRKNTLLGTVAVAAVMTSGAAWAQAAAPASGAALQEVVVTASRVVRNGFAAPTPLTVIGQEELQQRAAVNVADILNESPAFRPTITPQGRAFGGNFGANSVDLRGLGTNRTLVLVNGRRHVASSTQGEVDINVIPTSLVERTEVVTGGASASWGSDAVAGVVNIILKNRLQGVQGNISYGTTDKSDDNSYNASLAAGTSFAGGRGHVMIGGEYDMMNGLPFAQKARDWSSKLWGSLAMPANRAAGLPANIIAPGFHYSNVIAAGGIISGDPKNGPLANTTFLPGGIPVKFVNGPIVAGGNMFGGDNANLSFTTDAHVVNPAERGAVLGRIEYQLTPHINSFVEIGGGTTDQRSFTAGRLTQAGASGITIKNDNAFLPASIKTQMAAAGLTQLIFGRYESEIGRYLVHNNRSVRRGVIGFNGDVGGGWTWDAYYQYGANRSFSDVANNTSLPNYFAAIDAVAGPNGTIVCRSLTTSSGVADPGCVPYNVFGVGAPSQAAQDYVSRASYIHTYTREQVAAANLRGEPFSVWAGPVSLATGVEWRRESTSVKSDLNSQLRRLSFLNAQPIKGEFDVKEVYAETVVPLAKDVGFISSVDLTGAVRRTDYSLSGAVTTWKFGATFEDSTKQLRLRGTRSRDIRAPNLEELFGAGTVAVTNIIDTGRSGTGLLQRVLTSGSTALKPEIADTFTYGAVVSPNFIPGFRVSADYYNIAIAGVITQIGGQNIVDRCARGATDLCQFIIRNPAGEITSIINNSLNLNEFKTSGVDIEASYRVPLSKFNAPGNLNLRLLATYVHDLITIDSAGPVDRVKQTVPQWVYNLSANYDIGRFSTNLTARVLSKTTVDTTKVGPEDAGYNPALPNSINRNRNPAVLYLNLSAQYSIIDSGSRKLVLYGVVNNLTDRDPPGFQSNLTAGNIYDLVGRFIRVGVRFNY